MITAEKLAIFQKFNGDIDNWCRGQMPGCDIFGDQDWAELNVLIQELGQLKNNLLAPDYAERVRKKLSAMAPNENVACAIMEMA